MSTALLPWAISSPRLQLRLEIGLFQFDATLIRDPTAVR